MSLLFSTDKDRMQFAEDMSGVPSDPEAFKPSWYSGILSEAPKGLARGALKTKQFLTYTTDDKSVLELSDDDIASLQSNPISADLVFGGQRIGVQSPEQKELVKQWDKKLAPDPLTTGWAGQTINSLFDVGGRAVAGTVLTGSPFGGAVVAGGTEAHHAYQEEIDQGVDSQTALGVAGIEGMLTALGVVVPASFGFKPAVNAITHGKSLTPVILKNVLGYGPATMEVQGIIQRGAMHEWLDANGHHDLAKQYQWFDTQAMASDYVMGAFFGGLGSHHVIGKARPIGELNKINLEAARLPEPLPSHVDAALTVNNHLHIDVDTAPGIPADATSLNAHVSALRETTDALLHDREPQLAGILDEVKFIDTPELPKERQMQIVNDALKDAGYHDLVDELNRLPTEEAAAEGVRPVPVSNEKISTGPAENQIAKELPELPVVTPDGTTTAREALDRSVQEVADANNTAKAFSAAVECFIRNGT